VERTAVVVKSWSVEQRSLCDHVILRDDRGPSLRHHRRARSAHLKRAVAEGDAEVLASVKVNCKRCW
jgi:hypothetical protein